jgi:hypothetical protein
MLELVRSLGIMVSAGFSERLLFSSMDDSTKIMMPAPPKKTNGSISASDWSAFRVIIRTVAAKPTTAIIPPSSLPSISGNCLSSDFIAANFLLFKLLFPSRDYLFSASRAICKFLINFSPTIDAKIDFPISSRSVFCASWDI